MKFTTLLIMLACMMIQLLPAQEPAKPAAKPPAPKPVPVPYIKPTLENVAYGPHERNVIDFYKAESSVPTPLILFIHGGGWQAGDKSKVHSMINVKEVLAQGISVAAINYRYVKQAGDVYPPVKVPLHDAAHALQFIRSKAQEWNIDKTRIGATGGSAGACTSLWLAFHDDLADPKSNDPIARESTRLVCAAVSGPQTTLDPQQMKDWTPNSKYGAHAFGLKTFNEFLESREKIEPLFKEYSPWHLVTSDDPPVGLYFKSPPALGKEEKDPTHSANFGIKLQEHCLENKVSCEFVYPNAENVKHPTIQDYLVKTLKSK